MTPYQKPGWLLFALLLACAQLLLFAATSRAEGVGGSPHAGEVGDPLPQKPSSPPRPYDEPATTGGDRR